MEQSGHADCEGCARYRAAIDAVTKWLEVELGNTGKDETHLRGTLRCAIEALGPRNPRLYPQEHHDAPAVGNPPPGETLDEQAARLAANCASGYEEAEAVVLRRAADLLLARAHGPRESRPEPRRGPFKFSPPPHDGENP
jgi:hypothetical protein